jgi:hypothetical protein
MACIFVTPHAADIYMCHVLVVQLYHRQEAVPCTRKIRHVKEKLGMQGMHVCMERRDVPE